MALEQLAARLCVAFERRDSAALAELLSPCVRLTIDTGDDTGRVLRSRRDAIPALLAHGSAHRCSSITVSQVNGVAGIVLRNDRGSALGVLALAVRGRRVIEIWMVTAPAKLARWQPDETRG